MALEQIQGKAGSLSPDELDRLALQYKPSWEIDFAPIAPVAAVVAVPKANGAQANGNGAASQAHAESVDKPKVAGSVPAGAPRPVGIKSTVMGTGALAEQPPVAEMQPPAPPVEAVAVETPQPSAPVENVIADVAGTEAIALAVAAPEEPAAPAADDTAPIEIAEAASDAAAPQVPETEHSGLSEAPAAVVAVVAEQAEAANENAEEKPQAKPVASMAEVSGPNASNDTAIAEPPLDAIPMQSSSSGTMMKAVFALVAVVGLVFVGASMLGGSEKDKPKPATNSQAATTPTETVTAKPEQPAAPPPETPKTVEAAPVAPKPAKTDAPKPADAPKAETKTAEAPKPDAPKPDAPKPVVTATAVTKATVALAPKPPSTPAPRPTTTATAKTGDGIIRVTPF